MFLSEEEEEAPEQTHMWKSKWLSICKSTFSNEEQVIQRTNS
jgi:hypothetical protein